MTQSVDNTNKENTHLIELNLQFLKKKNFKVTEIYIL